MWPMLRMLDAPKVPLARDSDPYQQWFLDGSDAGLCVYSAGVSWLSAFPDFFVYILSD